MSGRETGGNKRNRSEDEESLEAGEAGSSSTTRHKRPRVDPTDIVEISDEEPVEISDSEDVVTTDHGTSSSNPIDLSTIPAPIFSSTSPQPSGRRVPIPRPRRARTAPSPPPTARPSRTQRPGPQRQRAMARIVDLTGNTTEMEYEATPAGPIQALINHIFGIDLPFEEPPQPFFHTLANFSGGHSTARVMFGFREFQFDETPQVQGASTQQINKLKKYKLPEDSEDVCCVCLDAMKKNQMVRKLGCVHFFHSRCIDKWLKQNQTCPICKSEIPP